MKSRSASTALIILAIFLPGARVNALSTINVLGNGVCINEILIDPDGLSASTDTDGNGTIADSDEFVELFNLSAYDIDISGWQ
ncbi:MAG: hypothetical protein P1S60_17170, partial [Anaerolineae bacterium]|nr:hypothetical protein [Anaerolineae bacterium]